MSEPSVWSCLLGFLAFALLVAAITVGCALLWSAARRWAERIPSREDVSTLDQLDGHAWAPGRDGRAS